MRHIKKGMVIVSVMCLLTSLYTGVMDDCTVEAKAIVEVEQTSSVQSGSLNTPTDGSPGGETDAKPPANNTKPEIPTTPQQSTTTQQSSVTTEKQTEASTEITTEAKTEANGTIEVVTTQAIETTEEDNTEEIEEDPYKDYQHVRFEQGAENRVEQVQGNLPTIWTVFYYNGKNGELQSEKPENVRMLFHGNEWQASELKQWKKTGYGIHYYVLLDTSGSVQGYFDELIDAINGLALRMEEHDTLTVYTVGNETNTLTPIIENATAEDTSRIKDKLATLSASDERTYLNNAIVDIVKMIQSNNQNNMEDDFTGRDIILVLSDGENDSNTGKTNEEVKEALKDANIPVYAFMNKNAQATDGNALEGIAASSSGEGIYVEDNDFSGSLEDRVNAFQDAWIATFSDTDAIESEEYTVELSLILNDSKEIWEYASKTTTFYRAKPDTEAPSVVGVALTGDNSIDITFNEFVTGADEVSAYQLERMEEATADAASKEQSDQKLQVINVAEVGEHTEYTYRLTLNERVYRGDYRLSLQNITDLQGNPLTPDSYDITFVDAPEKAVDKESFAKRFWWIFLIVFLVVLVVILLIVFHIIKKNKGIVIVDDKAVLAGNTEVKQHIVLEQQKSGQPITLYLYSGGKMIKKIDASVQGSMMVGRSDLCDLFIDDVMMSRQHFAIEFDGESFYIQDLDTTNGTMLNGVKMVHKRRLEKNDRITAGSLDIVVRW